MKKMIRLLALTLALMLCMLPVLAETSADDVLATVNGEPVTRADYEEMLANLNDEYGASYDMSNEMIAAMFRQIAMEYAVNYAAEEAMLKDIIAQNNLQLTEEELADAAQLAREDFSLQVDAIVDQYAAYGMADVSTDEGRAAAMVEILAQLESMGVTEASYIAEMQVYAGYDKAYEWLFRDVTVSEDEVRALFDTRVEEDRIAYENDFEAYEAMQQQNQMALMYGMTEYYVDLYYMPTGYRLVTHILLETDETAQAAYNALLENPDATADEIAAAEKAVIASVQPTIDEINARLAEGESFNSLIPDYTMDPGMADEASIAQGYEVHPQSTMWVTPFRDAAFTVENVGDVTAPVVTDFGVHILYYAADLPGGPIDFEEMRPLLEEELLNNKLSDCAYDALMKWMETAEIVYSDEAKGYLGAN